MELYSKATLNGLKTPAMGRYVYFISWDDGPIKIGMAANISRRLAGLQGCCPYKLRVLAFIDGGRGLEAEYHAEFAADRLMGEWFERTPALEAEIARIVSGKPKEVPHSAPMSNAERRTALIQELRDAGWSASAALAEAKERLERRKIILSRKAA